MPAHLRRDLDKLKRMILSFGAAVEESARLSTKALRDYDANIASKVIDRDTQINRDEVEIEEECLKILALHQPVAIDLRFVVTVLKVNSDLERIADFCVNTSKRVRSLAKQPAIAIPKELLLIAEKAISMVKASLDCLIEQDVMRARAVCLADDEVDDLQRRLYDIVLAEIKANPEHTSQWMQVFSMVRYFERMGDYATNIAEDVIYLVDGEVIRHKDQN